MGTKKSGELKKICKLDYSIYFFCLVCYILGMLFFPRYHDQTDWFQFYTVLSGSMEPKIPTYSLVLSKNIKSDDELVPAQSLPSMRTGWVKIRY